MYPHGANNPLSTLLKQPGVHLGSGIHVLDLKLELNAKCPDFGLRALLPPLHNLRHFRLSVERALNLENKSQMATLSARSLGSDLDPVRKTLKSLCICTEHDRIHRDGSSIGDLRHLTSLESLSIQSHVLFGDRSNNRTKSLQQILPLSIQELLFDCCADDIETTGRSWRYPLNVTEKRAETICFMIDDLLRRSPEALQGLSYITLLQNGAPLGHLFPARIASLFKRLDNIQATVLERGMRFELKTFRRQWTLTTNSSPFSSHQRPYYLEKPLPCS